MSTRHRGLAWSLRATCAASLLALTLPALSFAAPIGEQIDRADGIAGTSALADTYAGDPQLSDDGRFAAFGYYPQSGSKSGQIAPSLVPVLGVYVRDVVTNRTVQIVSTSSPSATQFKLTADGTKLSFVSTARLVPADTDNESDIYIADTTTKALTLATNTTESVSGTITRDGSAILWGRETTLRRTVLATGATTTIATDSNGIAAANADGTIVAYRTSADPNSLVFWRSGRTPLTVYSGAPDTIYTVVLSPDGKTAALLPWNQRNVKRLDVDTGAISSAAWNVSGYPTGGTFNLSNDGWLQISATTADYKKTSVGEVNLRTREIRLIAADLGWVPGRLTPNGKFATAGYGHLYVVPLGATPLPGTVDPPSPFAYLRFDYGCRMPSILVPNPKPYLAVGTIFGLPIPAPVSASIVIRDRATNQIANQFTITSPTATYPISPVSGNFRVDASVKLADGRTVTGTYYQDSYARAECFPNGL